MKFLVASGNRVSPETLPAKQQGRYVADTILTTAFGKSFTSNGFGNFMADKIAAAALPDRCVTHGLRKAASRRLAEAGCSANEIAAITGHTTLAEVSRYTKAAEQRHLARAAIERLPGGYGQRIGKRFKNGVELSGGEWQKVAIARAYMREAEVLILDEPTAALDARAEFEVFQRFKELSAGKTAVLISHRFSSVRMADRIFVLADGKVEATGTHEELVSQPGLYSELFELQAAGYR